MVGPPAQHSQTERVIEQLQPGKLNRDIVTKEKIVNVDPKPTASHGPDLVCRENQFKISILMQGPKPMTTENSLRFQNNQ
jgi:hypothetical protein